MITREMIYDDAASLGVDPASVLAVAEVESNGSGFLADGRPAILFEALWFHKFTGGKFDASHPDISSPVWDRSLYKGGAAEWGRLNAAIELDAEAAFKSASYGAFQIMGFNYAACGFQSVTMFFSAMKRGLDEQVAAFTAFIKANPAMLQALRLKDWKTFARLYNGPGAVASYSAKIADAYAKYADQPRPEEGPPAPVADPTLKPKSAMSSTTVLTTGTAALGTATVVGQNLQPAIDAMNTTANTISQAKSSWDALKDAFAMFDNGHIFTVFVLALVIGGLLYVGIRYIHKARNGDVVVR